MEELVLEKKLKLWQNRLLDLSKRNRMISFKDTSAQVIRLINPGFDDLYQKLVIDGKSLTIKKPVDQNMDAGVFAMIRLMHHMSENISVGMGEISTSGTLEVSARKTKNIKKYTDLFLQEKGTNILYLSFGFLYWRDFDSNDKWLKAPLILVPAELNRLSNIQPFYVKKTDEEMVVNPTFAYYLEMNHGIKMPELRSFSNMQDVQNFLDQISVIVEKKGWRVEKEVYLSTMSFLKTNMYNDLIENEEAILKHPIIRAFAGEKNEFTTLDESTIDFRHDEKNVDQVFEVLNADSSQKDAVELSRRGISFVMQGPPGTGKSQTIANIISQGIAEGRKILFVSEKQAALDVVYKRLQEVGLADLCLPLHDPKTNKQTVLKQLEKNLDALKLKINNDQLAEIHKLDGLKSSLNSYAFTLHKNVEPLNMSLYEAYQMLFSLSDVPDVILSLRNLDTADRADMNRMIREVSEYEISRDVLGEKWYENPWIGIKKQNLSNSEKQKFKENIEQLERNLKAVCEYKINDSKCLGDVITWADFKAYEEIGRLIAGFSTVPKEMVLDYDEQHVNGLPEDIQKSIDELADFYEIGSKDLLMISANVKTSSISALEKFQKLKDLLLPVNGLSERISYIQIFQLRQLMLQYGLDARQPSITESYFSIEGIKKVYEIERKRREQFAQTDNIKRNLLHRYSEEILNIDFGISEEQLVDILSQIINPGKNVGEELLSLLEKNGISVSNQANSDEILSVVKTLLEGAFDNFISLDENEFYFVYDLFEEARKKEEAQDTKWFDECKDMLKKYTNEKTLGIPGIWDEYVILANDFYYVKNAYPELLKIVSLDKEERKNIAKYIEHSGKDDGIASEIVGNLNKYARKNVDMSPGLICEDIKELFEYKSILKQAEESFISDATVIGNQYLMASTDWELIGNNIDFIKILKQIYKENEIDGIKQFLVNISEFDWENLDPALNDMIGIGKGIPAIENMAVSDVISRLDSNITEIDSIKEKSAVWREMCIVAEKIHRAVYIDGSLAIDRDVLEIMLESDSRGLFDITELLCELNGQAGCMQKVLNIFENPELLTEVTISNLQKRLGACLKQFSEYDTMVEYQVCADHCRSDGLNAFLSRAYQVRQKQGTLGQIFEKAFLTTWIDMVSEENESISAFSSRTQSNKIEEFKALDRQQLSITRWRVLSLAQEKMPSRRAGKVVGEMGILLREISKSKNVMSIRNLFNSIPTLLLTLKPCLMMSPLSVAYFLKADLFSFDTVIFDEASQIFPENAIGAILRGKQVIIAGDSKQMPPTNFFQAATGFQDEIDDEDIILNTDSILEEAENALPNLSLTWHYRSRNESLITFSNRNMYAGSLVTFPNNAPNERDFGVEYEYVEHGVYENRCNEREALRCVDLTIESFVKHPERSVGIIAFSTTQEECIERAFERFRESDNKYEQFFREGRENPFFIKNLENVQGDERDTIILSVGYGRNAQDVLRYNFGPLGMQGGERRMNVAITRAKYNIKLVTSLRPEDFDKSKLGSNSGAKLLHDYISYAIYGPESINDLNRTGTDDGLKKYICDILKSEGYTTTLDIGNSGYKVEIAVEDSQNPGVYIAGIETDGQNYVLARNVRDRECLRPDMIKNMGWDIYRVWSTQWIRDPETEKRKLLEFVKQRANAK